MRFSRRSKLTAELPRVDPVAGGATAVEFSVLERRLGYAFGNRGLLRQALTHKSAGADNYERLEYLGDAALGYVVAWTLFELMPPATEQRLTLMRAKLVNTTALATMARELDLGAFLNLGAGERESGGTERVSILADALEAVIGAIVCDGGLDAVSAVIRRLFNSRLAALDGVDLKDPKTRLQEYLQSRHLALPRYKVISATGKQHQRVHTVECVIDDLAARAEGAAGSRRAAEMAAAEVVLAQLEAT